MNLLIQFILLVILYFISVPFSFWIKDKIVFEMKKKRRNNIRQNNNTEELTLKQKINREKKFGLKEASNKNMIRFTFIVSILIGPAISYVSLLWGIILSYFLPYIFIGLVHNAVSVELAHKDKLISRILDFKKSKMGLIDNKSDYLNYSEEFAILENDKEDNKPSKIRLFLPVNFDPLQANTFLADFSTQFGRGRPFEIDYEDKDFPGWDTDKGVATISLQAPLPTMAKWDKHYLEDPIVQWSFIPLGLSSRGGLPIKNPETGEIEHVVGFDLDGTQKKYCDKNGIHIGPDIIASPMTLIAGVTGGGKSVAQWNIMNSCLARPDKWLLFGIDMKKVELSQLRQYGVAVGTTMEDAADIACFVQKVMMDRYELMERLGINNWDDVPQEYDGPAILLLVDEAGELLSEIKGKDEISKANQECQDRIRAAFESIARLGRAARVFLVCAAQRPSSDVIPMQVRQNMSNKLAAGSLPATISQMLFENNEGQKVKGNPKGRIGLKVHSSDVIHAQGFYSPTDWIDGYLKEKGWPKKIYEDSSFINDLNESKEANSSNAEEAMSEEDFDLLESVK